MEATKLIQVGNFIVTLVTEEQTPTYLVVENIGRGWEVRYSEECEMFSALMVGIKAANEGNDNAKSYLEATLCGIFVVSTIGIHDADLTNSITVGATEYVKRVKAIIERIEKENPTEDDSAAWMERENKMEDMAKAIGK